jgi:hypothetical protein
MVLLKTTGAIALATIAGLATLPLGGATQASPCRTAADTSGVVLYSVKQLLATNGLDATVSLVSDSITCQAVVDGYNAASDSVLHVQSGYVVQANSTLVLYLPPAPGTPYVTETVVLFDSEMRILLRLAGLR